jgi:hypothetical protein
MLALLVGDFVRLLALALGISFLLGRIVSYKFVDHARRPDPGSSGGTLIDYAWLGGPRLLAVRWQRRDFRSEPKAMHDSYKLNQIVRFEWLSEITIRAKLVCLDDISLFR